MRDTTIGSLVSPLAAAAAGAVLTVVGLAISGTVSVTLLAAGFILALYAAVAATIRSDDPAGETQ